MTKSFDLKVKLSSHIASFAPGMYVKAKIIYGRKDVQAMDLSVRNVDGGIYYIDYSDGETRARFIDASNALSDNNYFEVPEEVKDFDIIVRGQSLVLSGQSVEIVEGF